MIPHESTSPTKNDDGAPSGCANCTRLAAINADLYAALSDLLDGIDGIDIRFSAGGREAWYGRVIRARAAIAKAEGGGP